MALLEVLHFTSVFSFFSAIGNEMLRVKQKVKEEKEQEKKIYAKMFA